MFVHAQRRVIAPAMILFVATVFVTGAAVPESAAQNLDAEALIGYAVEKVGPEHDDVNRAIQAFAGKDYDTARQLLEQARRRDNKLPPAGISMGKMYLLSNQAAAGRAELERVVKDYPNDPEPILIFAERAVLGGRILDAELLFQHADRIVERYNDNLKRKQNFLTRLHVGLASVAERRENWAESVTHLQKWVESQPDNIRSHQRLGRAYFELEQYRQAYDEFVKAQQIDPSTPSADVIMARLYQNAGDEDTATKFMERALSSENANVKTRLAGVRWLIESGELPRARTLIDQLLVDDPSSVDVRLFAGIIYRMINQPETALKHLEEAYLKAPQNFDAVNQLALFLIEQPDESDKNRAVQLAEMNMRQHRNNSEAAASLGWIYYQVGRTKESQQLLNAALKTGRLSADSSFFIGKIFYDRGQNDATRKLLETALQSKKVFVNRTEAERILQSISGNN